MTLAILNKWDTELTHILSACEELKRICSLSSYQYRLKSKCRFETLILAYRHVFQLYGFALRQIVFICSNNKNNAQAK